MQESSPLQGTYADALPLGPLMELRAKSESNDLTAARASETLAYWEQAAGKSSVTPPRRPRPRR